MSTADATTTADVFMSSSPPRPSRITPQIVASSSPDIPSLSEIFAKHSRGPPLKRGNNATPLPTASSAASTIPPTFTNAAALLREAPEINIDTEKITKSSLKPKSVNGLLEKLISSAQSSNEEPWQSGADKQPDAISIESSPKEKPWQKFKSRTPTPTPTPEAKKPPIPKARITKAASEDKLDKLGKQEKQEKQDKFTKPTKPRQARLATGTVSEHFTSKKANTQLRRKGSDIKEPAEYSKPDPFSKSTKATAQSVSSTTSCSEPALRRRVDWTPPPADDAIVITSDSDHKEFLSSADNASSASNVFQTLHDSFTYKHDNITAGVQPQPQQKPQEIQSESFLRKRKRIDMVPTSAPIVDQDVQQSREASPSKPAAIKKKTKTITELATAPYLPPPIPEFDLSTRTARDSLLEYFDSGAEVKALIEHQSVIMSNNKGTAKPTKAKAKPRKKKAGTADAPILLSPNSALKLSSNQDFVFGTSSQLVGEESPTTLRHLQLAIQASNRDDDDPFSKSDSRNRLWRAGARDNDGDLMEVEVVDLAQTPALPKPQPEGLALRSDPTPLGQLQSDDFVDIDNIPLDTPCAQKIAPPTEPSLSSVPVQTAPETAPALPNTTATVSSSAADPRPNYEKLTDGQLSRQIATYGFKPVKKRQAMIALLDQCWASKNAGPTSVPTQPISTTVTVASPKRKGKPVNAPPPIAVAPADPVEKPTKRPRGRPKKNPDTTVASTSASATASPKSRKSAAKKPRAQAKKTTKKTREIADSASDGEDGAATPSPSAASSPEPTFSSPPPVDLDLGLDGSDDEDQSLALTSAATTKDARQAELFRHITRAVKTEPRSRDPAAPSWHEKMLLYDPVVLEDLAAWLNAGQLTRVGFDGEADPLDVKAWCEARSVVCLWRQNSRGRARKRY